MQFEKDLALAIKAARAAGDVLHRLRREDPRILAEVGRDIKLQADQDAEAVILNILAASEYPQLAEESGLSGEIEFGTPYWAVDPLDGTLNFSRAIPICCVSIALMEKDRPILGVIYDFNRDELFSGIAGEASWLNGEPIRVSTVTSAAAGVLTTGLPTKRQFDDASLLTFLAEIQRFKKVRMLGSAAIMLAYVACGRADAYAEDDIMLWDVAAGIAIIQGAGGYVRMEPSPRLQWAQIVRCANSPALWNAPEN